MRSQALLNLQKELQSPRSLFEMCDFWVNQHAQSTHMIIFLPYGNLHPTRGGKGEDTSQLHPQSQNRIHDPNLEATPKELCQLYNKWRISSPLRQYV